MSAFLGRWHDFLVDRGWPSPVGLLMGLGSVLVFQVAIFAYYAVRRLVFHADDPQRGQVIQLQPGIARSTLAQDLWSHLSAPESFLMVFGYLTAVWMFRLLPASYYDLDSGPSALHVGVQMLLVDFFTYVSHRVEHGWSALYVRSHKPHHRFYNPKLYNAFNGSELDTLALILVPLFLTAKLANCFVPVCCWDFIVFGTVYASQFTLIHCEFAHPWDPLLRRFGVGTAEDHHVHHCLVHYNYGHFLMFWDWLFGTYRSHLDCHQMREAQKKARS